MTQTPEELKVSDGHDETHDPAEASWLLAHVRQKFEVPAQVEQLEEQAVHVRLSDGFKNVPVGQLSTHVLLESTFPGRQPVHCSWFTVDATLKFGILQDVHFDGQPTNKIRSPSEKWVIWLTVTLVLIVVCDQV